MSILVLQWISLRMLTGFVDLMLMWVFYSVFYIKWRKPQRKWLPDFSFIHKKQCLELLICLGHLLDCIGIIGSRNYNCFPVLVGLYWRGFGLDCRTTVVGRKFYCKANCVSFVFCGLCEFFTFPYFFNTTQ